MPEKQARIVFETGISPTQWLHRFQGSADDGWKPQILSLGQYVIDALISAIAGLYRLQRFGTVFNIGSFK